MSNQQYNLVRLIQNAIRTNELTKDVFLPVYEVLMLPDTIYNAFFTELAASMSMDKNIVIDTFKRILNNFIASNQSFITEVSQQQDSKKLTERQISHNQFVLVFRHCLMAVYYRHNDRSIKINSDQQLCETINTFMKSFGHVQFWKAIQQLIPDKTVKQLRDFYAKSFQKVLFETQMEEQDKLMLRKMVDLEGSPSDIADKFLQLTGKNYFQRNIIMYVINLRRRQQK
ncbi:Hypothetical_protein [Hexamita inflata]|uniref:Hypothetical_protein n=1 Tax=Hexamita inflata TaxID=28002 RepID=A0AA86NYP3_9EUKA|nr:Hypothetical protein HINF_LOCUS14814 [Hexamita inflata]